MPTPKQHAKSALKSLRQLIVDLQAAVAEGVTLQFLDQGETPDAEAAFRLSHVAQLLYLNPTEVGVRANITTTVVVDANEPDAAV